MATWKTPEDFGDLPTVDTSSRFSADQELRKAGCRIHSRPRGQEPTWAKGDTLAPESVALESIGFVNVEAL